MNVGAEPDVVREIPADVIGVVVKDNVVTVPEPVSARTHLERCDAEIIAAKPEATRAASLQTKHKACSDAAGKAPMLPRMIEVQARIISKVVPHPLAVPMHMWRTGMTRIVGSTW